jgi:hypothetical protein
MKRPTYPFMSSDITDDIFKYTDKITGNDGPNRNYEYIAEIPFNNICINNKYLADTYQFK